MEPDTKEVNYEKKSEIYKDLVALLAARSTRFAQNIAKKVSSTNTVLLKGNFFLWSIIQCDPAAYRLNPQ